MANTLHATLHGDRLDAFMLLERGSVVSSQSCPETPTHVVRGSDTTGWVLSDTSSQSKLLLLPSIAENQIKRPMLGLKTIPVAVPCLAKAALRALPRRHGPVVSC